MYLKISVIIIFLRTLHKVQAGKNFSFPAKYLRSLELLSERRATEKKLEKNKKRHNKKNDTMASRPELYSRKTRTLAEQKRHHSA
jgi:hypothetical protein